MIRLFVCLVAVSPLLAQVKGDCHSETRLGIEAFKNGGYAKSVEHFQAALNLDSTCAKARLYLATAYMQQYIPGVDSPDNNAMAKAAREQFDKVLEAEPANKTAIVSIVSLCFNEKKLDEAADWSRRMIALDAAAYESFYTLGVIAWQQSLEADKTARERTGMRPEDPGPIRDPAARSAIRAHTALIIDEGIASLYRALTIRPDYADAMAYLNLLYRQKADIEDSAQAYADDIAQANDWFQKTIEIRKAQATAGGGTGDRSQPPHQ